MTNRLSSQAVERLSKVLVFSLALLVFGDLSVAFARAAQRTNDPVAVGAKTPAEDPNAGSLEIPGTFKDVANSKTTQASKQTRKERTLQRGHGSTEAIAVDERKGVAKGQPKIASKAKRISIPIAQLDGAGQLHDFNATAYCLKGRTASGHHVRPGVIAADPRVLPLGTVVHLQAGSYSGVYTVLDTGGRIKGKKIDVYVTTRKEALAFGRRQVRLKVIGRSSLRGVGSAVGSF
jgi:3D (Asp-Asp-Asp) domain-containing protein